MQCGVGCLVHAIARIQSSGYLNMDDLAHVAQKNALKQFNMIMYTSIYAIIITKTFTDFP